MNAPRPSTVFAMTYACAFSVLYAIAIRKNLALFTYYPAVHEVSPLVEFSPPDGGPAMYWYGCIATAGLGALLVSILTRMLPVSWSSRLWSGWSWTVPLAVLLLIVYLNRHYFLR